MESAPIDVCIDARDLNIGIEHNSRYMYLTVHTGFSR